MPELISPLELIAEDVPSGETMDPPGISTGDLDAIRDLVLRAHPDIVPELLIGETVADLLASVEPARSAWTRLADRLAERQPVTAPLVPAGGGAPVAIDPDRLPPAEKIRRGLATASQKG